MKSFKVQRRCFLQWLAAAFGCALERAVTRPSTSWGLTVGEEPAVKRQVLAFYYPWYGNPAAKEGSGRWSHWEGIDLETRTIKSSTHFPELGPYDSHDPAVIRQHCRWAVESGVTGFIASWWGHGSFEDRAMPRLLDLAAEHSLAVSAYYETVPGNPKTAERAASDITRLLEKYGKHPAWLKVAGRPVLFIYGRAIGELGVAAWGEVRKRVDESSSDGVVLQGDQFSPQAAEVFDGLHTYITAGQLRGKSLDEVRAWCQDTFPRWVKLTRDTGRISTLTVIPGYDDTKIRSPGLRVDRFEGQSYVIQWEAALAAQPDWVLITSWNEWHEGSEIEPSVEHGRRYLDLTREMSARFLNPR